MDRLFSGSKRESRLIGVDTCRRQAVPIKRDYAHVVPGPVGAFRVRSKLNEVPCASWLRTRMAAW